MKSVTIQFKELVKQYDRRTLVLDHINLEIEKGEFVVLVGPSGCGKSTLLRTLAGLENMTGGEIIINGKVVNEVHPSERGLAMVFQDYALYPHMSVRDNLKFGLKMKGVDPVIIQQRIDEVSELLQINNLLDRRPAKLSGGQRQRVAIGRALVRKPEIFLFDEPLSNLDAQLRSQMRIELADLHRKIGSTTVYVTHDQVEAMTLATRIVILNRGRIQQVGSPLEVYHNPANEFVASFIGSPSMNLIPGDLQLSQTHCSFHFGDQKLSIPAHYAPRKPGRYTMGIRPEKISLDTQGPILMRGNLLIIEPLGNEFLVVLKCGGHQLTLRIQKLPEGQSFQSGEPIEFSAEPQNFLWFDPGCEGTRVHLDR